MGRTPLHWARDERTVRAINLHAYAPGGYDEPVGDELDNVRQTQPSFSLQTVVRGPLSNRLRAQVLL